MTLRHMKIFVAVFRHSSITKASRELHLAQPSVSLCIRELEEYYGVSLFERIGRGITPTEAGKEFYGYAIHIVDLFEEMEKKIRNWDTLGKLRLGASITIGTHILPVLIQRYQKEFAKLRIEVIIDKSAVIEEHILNNTIDLGLIESSPDNPDLDSMPFIRDSLCAVTAPDHPLTRLREVTLSEIARYPFLMREKGSAGREMLEACFSEQQMAVRPLWESASTQAIVRGVAAGIGVAILPRLLVKKDIEEGTIAEVPLAKPLERNLNMICHRSKYVTPNMKAFMKLCREYGGQQETCRA